MTKQENTLKAEDSKVKRIKAEIRYAKEQKRLSEVYLDWDIVKKKKWEEYCEWNQEMEQRKAKLLSEIERLEHKRDVLLDNLRIYES